MTRYDVAVIGLGAMGAAVLHQLARRGVRVVGLDRHAPPHVFGSTHGETRLTRCAVGEGDAYVPFAQRSNEIWRAIEAETGDDLLQQVGCLIMAPKGSRIAMHGTDDFIERSFAIARRHAIPHERLDADAIARRFPALVMRGDEEAFFEPSGGYLSPERCVAAQLRLAEADGATMMTGCTVTGLRQRGGFVEIDTDHGPVEAAQAVVAAGAWAGPLLGAPFDRALVPFRQEIHWFPVAPESREAASRMPTWIRMLGSGPDDCSYGFPLLPGCVDMKVAEEQFEQPCDPDRVERTIDPAASERVYAMHVADRLHGVGPVATRAATCLYTVSPDFGFVIDRHPEQDRVMVVSPCSGHGFKHSAAIGEAVAEWVTDGRSTLDLAAFAAARLGAMSRLTA
jgi:sarcosine oxidase